MAVKNNSNELKITRIYDAPVKMVWDAWIEPDQVAQWWGPRGFTLTTYSKDVRTGGSWHYVMHGPDGTDYQSKTQYLEVEKYSRMVYDHGGYEDRAPLFRVTVTFAEVKGGKTKMEMTMTLPTPEAARETEKFIKKAGGNSTWDRLAEFLEKESSGKDKFIINRSFNVPLETMFEMWTNPNHFSKWLPPTGFTMQFLQADMKVGGSSLFFMTDGGSTKMYGRTSYQEIIRPHRVVYTQQFTDEKGNVSRHPMVPTWPETMLTIVELTAEGPEQTRVTVSWEPVGNITHEEIQTFIKERAGMTQGWTGSFDKLEEYIERNRH